MAEMELMHLYPTLEMLAEELNRMGFACRAVGNAGERRFRGARFYVGQAALSEDVIYVVGPSHLRRFPKHGFACVGVEPMFGREDCLLCLNREPEAVLDALLEIFGRCRDMETRVDALVYRDADLNRLCELGAELLENPICIHDDWFVMIARSSGLAEVLQPDYVMSSSKEFIPRIIIEDFKNDAEYLETYVHRTAQLWSASPGAPACLYANLWEGEIYRGRLLVVRRQRDFRRLDYAFAELLAQRVLMLLNRNQPGTERTYRSMDDVVFDLLNGRQPETQEENRLLAMLGWSRGDELVCVRLEPQQSGGSAVLEHALHSDLFQAFPKGYILFAGRQQCVLLNAGQEKRNLSMLSHRLSPLCRDYCLYAGISSPVTGLRELDVAYLQARLALEKAFQLRSDRWLIPFSDCAMEYAVDNMQGAMKLKHLVAPELLMLLRYDRERDTRYFDTLRAYLLCERDIPRTSEALIIHRTTLLYRLRKLKEIVPLDLDDPWKRLWLTLSLWILEKGE